MMSNMKTSHLFTKTLRHSPKGETAKSSQYLLRAGYLQKQMAGVYAYLPLGLRVLENIKAIIRTEMNAIGGQEILMPALQSPEPWQKTERWDDKVMDIWFKSKLNAGGEVGLAATHEEPMTTMLKNYISSYKDLPVYIYQFQNKFRNELRAKSGILRTREFLMKDLYSFTTDRATHEDFYHQAEIAYKNVYDKLGIGHCTYKTFASGSSFSKYSHEFQTLIPVGEDTIWHNADFSIVLNEEVLQDEVLADLGVKREELTSATAAEVGNIFTLGYKFSQALDLNYHDQNDQLQPVFMGCYGIGVSRVLGIIAELFADDKGLIWPENIAPFRYYLIPLGDTATKLCNELHQAHPETILLDDRDERAGVKFADAELLGIPYRVVISDKTLATDSAELTRRTTGKTSLLTISALTAKLKSSPLPEP